MESIKSVADLVSDIAGASLEQSSGVDEVNRALTQMDEVTQQNSALVEENAATAKTLEHQAKTMDDRVSFFRIDDTAGAPEAARPAGSRGRGCGQAPGRPAPTARSPSRKTRSFRARLRPKGRHACGAAGRCRARSLMAVPILNLCSVILTKRYL